MSRERRYARRPSMHDYPDYMDDHHVRADRSIRHHHRSIPPPAYDDVYDSSIIARIRPSSRHHHAYIPRAAAPHPRQTYDTSDDESHYRNQSTTRPINRHGRHHNPRAALRQSRFSEQPPIRQDFSSMLAPRNASRSITAGGNARFRNQVSVGASKRLAISKLTKSSSEESSLNDSDDNPDYQEHDGFSPAYDADLLSQRPAKRHKRGVALVDFVVQRKDLEILRPGSRSGKGLDGLVQNRGPFQDALSATEELDVGQEIQTFPPSFVSDDTSEKRSPSATRFGSGEKSFHIIASTVPQFDSKSMLKKGFTYLPLPDRDDIRLATMEKEDLKETLVRLFCGKDKDKSVTVNIFGPLTYHHVLKLKLGCKANPEALQEEEEEEDEAPASDAPSQNGVARLPEASPEEQKMQARHGTSPSASEILFAGGMTESPGQEYGVAKKARRNSIEVIVGTPQPHHSAAEKQAPSQELLSRKTAPSCGIPNVLRQREVGQCTEEAIDLCSASHEGTVDRRNAVAVHTRAERRSTQKPKEDKPRRSKRTSLPNARPRRRAAGGLY